MRRVVLAVVAIGSLLVAAPARADEATVTTSVEAWYAVLPSITPRPADTLHIGVTAGLEDSRTYLALDVPPGEITGGTLHLPVDAADSSAPDTATIDVCVAGSPGPSVEASTDAPPPVDCTTHGPATYADGELTVDLAVFADTLRTSGLALVAQPGGTATWHVAVWGKGNASPDATPISATILLADEAVGVPSTTPPSPPTTTTFEVAGPAFSAPGADFASPAPLVITPTTVPALVPQLGPPSFTAPTPAAADAPGRYADSLVFALPLVLLALVGYFGSALTRPIDLRATEGARPPAGLPARRRAPLRARAAREQRASG